MNLPQLTPSQQAQVLDNQGLVWKIARQCETRCWAMGYSVEELASAGFLGLMVAVRGYNPDKQFKFSTYAWHVIARTMQRCCKKERLVREPEQRKTSRPIPPTNIRISTDATKHASYARDDSEDEQLDAKHQIAKAMLCLTEEERGIIDQRYFLKASFTQAAFTMGHSRETARKIQANALAKMQAVLSSD